MEHNYSHLLCKCIVCIQIFFNISTRQYCQYYYSNNLNPTGSLLTSLPQMDPRVLVASQRPGAKNYSGTARFSLSGLVKSCLGPKITPKQRVSLCVASLKRLQALSKVPGRLRGGYPRIREKWLDSQFVLNRIYIAEMSPCIF